MSQATVSLCLNDSPLVFDKTKARVKALAKAHKFTLNTPACNLKTQRSNTIGIVFPEHFADFSESHYDNVVYSTIRKNFAKLRLDLLAIYDNDHKDAA